LKTKILVVGSCDHQSLIFCFKSLDVRPKSIIQHFLIDVQNTAEAHTEAKGAFVLTTTSQ
jgi:hypothetical protein